MIPKECKRLAEVDFPIAVVSKHAAREKSIRHGHPSTLHLWWARRPLAACRAMLLGLLLPDPCDEHCPEEFKEKARQFLPKVQGQVGPRDEDLRRSLLKFIGDFANWDLSSDRTYLEVSRGLVKAAHPDETPLIVDPFAGGGSIPLEALRLGCDVFTSDLNPVACMILKILLDIIPRAGADLADRFRIVASDTKEYLENALDKYYPSDPNQYQPTAFLWARTVKCESPNCGAEIPIYRSGWLAKRGVKRARYFKEAADGPSYALLVSDAPRGGPIVFRIARGHGSEDARSGYISLFGTKAPGRTANVVCPCCNSILPGVTKNNRTAFQLSRQLGGGNVVFSDEGKRIGGAFLLAVVAQSNSGKGLHYRLPTEKDYEAIRLAQKHLDKLREERIFGDMTTVPEEPLPLMSGTFNVPIYGVRQWGDMFNARQNLALSVLVHKISQIAEPDLQLLMAAVLGRCVDYWSAGVRWAQGGEFVADTFARPALPIIWDFAETNPLGSASGNFQGATDWVMRVLESWPADIKAVAQVEQQDARSCLLPDESAHVWFTDPPYYFAVPYADLSDFFFVWLKRALPTHPLFAKRSSGLNFLTPKDEEICEMAKWDSERYEHKDKKFFEDGMRESFIKGRRLLRDGGAACVVFAHKTTEGWEALLSGMIEAKWVVKGSWPIATERPGRPRSQESAALATSIHIICGPRIEERTGDWQTVFRELPNRVGEWIERLQSEGIRGADLVFACIGPALEIYSRYSKVVDAEDREIPLGGDPEATEPHKRGYLAYVWEAVGRAALEQVLGTAEAAARNGVAGGLEEDARLTALFLWTLQTTNGEGSPLPSSSPARLPGRGQVKGEEISEEDEEEEEENTTPRGKKKKGLTLVFDVVRRFAQPLGIHLDNWEDRIIETEKGIVRLLPVGERGAQLFGQDGADLVAERLEREPMGALQLGLFPDRSEAAAPSVKRERRKGKKSADKDLRTKQEATTLDRVHAAMLLQASGRTNALRALLRAELDRGPDFLRLANALSALYPRDAEEKRLLDAMLLAVPK